MLERNREKKKRNKRKLFPSRGSVSCTSHLLTAVFFPVAVFSSPSPPVVVLEMDTTRSSSPELPNVGKSDTGSKSETKRDRKRKIITSDEVVAEEISSLEQPSDTVYSCMTLE